METNEIKYFLAVAKIENINKASEEIGVSPGSLSKAVARLEEELQVKLFSRVGRNIRLTEYGKFLKERGQDLLNLQDSIKTDILGKNNSFQVVIGGSEILLCSFGINLIKDLKSRYPLASFKLEVVEKSELNSKVSDGEIDIGLTTYDVPSRLDQKIISSINFSTFISSRHPLHKKVKRGSVHINDVLKYSFVVPNREILGRIHKSDSTDGWRDDKFPRIIKYSSTSLKTIEALVYEGEAIAYLPDFYGSNSNMVKLDIDGCPYSCKQKVRFFTKDKGRSGWLNSIF